MNPVERVIRRVDTAQQRFTPAAFVVGVAKKYGDDNGGVLAAALAHSAFVSLFPLLLILATLLGLTASLDPGFRDQVLHAVANQFPVVGSQLTGNVHVLRRSSIIGLIAGFVGLVWGASGLAQSGLFTMAQVWNLPGPARPGYVPRLGRAFIFLGLLGGGVLLTTGLAALNTYGQKAAYWTALAELAAAVGNVALYLAAFRVLTPKGVPAGRLVPGALAGGISYTLLQILGTFLVHHFLHSDSVYAAFGTVLGLVAWIYLVVEVTVYAAEINVVLTRRLWPRSIVQPPLTEADRTSLALQALQNQRREEQQVEVTFSDRGAGQAGPHGAPQTPDQVTPPAPEPPGPGLRAADPAGGGAGNTRLPGNGSRPGHGRAQLGVTGEDAVQPADGQHPVHVPGREHHQP
jgi:YihY family inner membrane protein